METLPGRSQTIGAIGTTSVARIELGHRNFANNHARGMLQGNPSIAGVVPLVSIVFLGDQGNRDDPEENVKASFQLHVCLQRDKKKVKPISRKIAILCRR